MGAPAGGGAEPSKSAGSRLEKGVLTWKQTEVAAAPDSIALRSTAQTKAFKNTKLVGFNSLKEK